MANTARSWPVIDSLLADNNTGNISPQDLRDALYSYAQQWAEMHVYGGTTTTSLSTSYATLSLTDFTNHTSSVGITADKANNRFILPAVAGVYEITLSLSLLVNSVTSVTYGIRALLDGAGIAGGQWENWRPASAGIAIIPAMSCIVDYAGSGNGYLTFQAIASTGTPTMTLKEGNIRVRRIA